MSPGSERDEAKRVLKHRMVSLVLKDQNKPITIIMCAKQFTRKIVAFSSGGKMEDYFKTKERWEIIKEYFNQNDIKYREVFTDSGSILSKLINLIYRLDYTSIYAAVMSGVDPGPVKPIDFIKGKL